MSTRERFEKWAGSFGWNLDRTDEGDYRTMSTDAAWGGWSACDKEMRQVYTLLCKDLARSYEIGKCYGCSVGAGECAKLIRNYDDA